MSVEIIQERLAAYACRSTLEEEQALREITQEIILAGLGRTDLFGRAGFQGGTCLRIFHGLNRFSEDMDFALDAPDTALVKVSAPDVLVEISKLGDNLRIAVDADDAIVRCTVPLDGVLYALEKWDWETFDPDLIFDTLGKADNGPLVTVEVDDGTKVAVNLW